MAHVKPPAVIVIYLVDNADDHINAANANIWPGITVERVRNGQLCMVRSAWRGAARRGGHAAAPGLIIF